MKNLFFILAFLSTIAGFSQSTVTVHGSSGSGGVTTAQVKTYERGPFYNISAALGSTVQYATVGLSQASISGAASNMVDNRCQFTAVYITETTTITGVKWWQTTAGNFTADNYNGVGLYSYSGGTLTLVASSTDDGNIWKATSASWNTKAFSGTYSASPGLYFIAALWNNSANTTAPQIGQFPALTAINIAQSDFTNSGKFSHYVAGNTLPSTQASSGTTAVANLNALFLY